MIWMNIFRAWWKALHAVEWEKGSRWHQLSMLTSTEKIAVFDTVSTFHDKCFFFIHISNYSCLPALVAGRPQMKKKKINFSEFKNYIFFLIQRRPSTVDVSQTDLFHLVDARRHPSTFILQPFSSRPYDIYWNCYVTLRQSNFTWKCFFFFFFF